MMGASGKIKLQVNGQPFELEDGSTANELLEVLEIQHSAVAVEVNSEICPRDQLSNTPLNSGDVVEVVSLVGGG